MTDLFYINSKPTRGYADSLMGGGGVRVKHQHWSDSGSSDSDDFTAVTVAAGETLLIWAWWRIPTNSDLEVSLMIDHVEVSPFVPIIQTSFDDVFTGSFFTAVEGLSGSHTVGLSSDGGAILGQGGLLIMWIPDGSFSEESRLGG